MSTGDQRAESDAVTSERSHPDGAHDDRADSEGLAEVLAFPSLGLRSSGPQLDTPRETLPEPRLRTVIGDVLRDERLRQERVLADVALRAAVSLPYLSEVERGRKEISSDVLAAVTDALDLTLLEFLDRCVERLRAGSQGGSGIQLRAA